MPYDVKRIGGKWRIVEKGTRKIAKGRGGKALDNGGHDSAYDAGAQASAVEHSEARKRRKGKR